MTRIVASAVVVLLVVICFLLGMQGRTLAAEPLASGIDQGNFDKTVRPQDDLFRYVNGGWLAKATIPADRAGYGAFQALGEEAEKNLRGIIEACANAKDNPPGSERQKIGDMYASFMDEVRAEKFGIEPIANLLAEIDAVNNKEELVQTFGKLYRVGVAGPLAAYVSTDAKKSDQHLLYLIQGGIGLPDRDYYWDPKLKSKLTAYTAHVERMLSLAKVANAKQAAADIVALETKLAKAQWSKVECRDSDKTYNPKTLKELCQLAPAIDWDVYFAAIGVKDVERVSVAQPSFFTALSGMINSVPLATWKEWLKWQVIREYAGLLNKEIADANFDFYGTTLQDIPQNSPRWKRAVAAVNGALGEAVGKLYVEKYFPPEAKTRMDRMVQKIIESYRVALQKNDWMGPETKQKALAKLTTFRPKIGYPVKWRDYSALDIRRDDLVGNEQRASAFEWKRMVDKLGKPVDRDEWHLTPQTVNAYYNTHLNEIVFPAAILQPPFFNLAADDAVNYGGIGTVIGHEIGHGFDDQGSKWDPKGNLMNWWTKADRKEFDRRGAMLAAQYDKFEPFPGFHVNGKFTLGENIGDLSGLTISYAAYRASLGGREAPVIDGLTGDQRFFIGFAQVWRAKFRDAEAKKRLLTDPHSPAECRANGTPRNVEGFYKAFGVKEGDKMYLSPKERVKIW